MTAPSPRVRLRFTEADGTVRSVVLGETEELRYVQNVEIVRGKKTILTVPVEIVVTVEAIDASAAVLTTR